MGRDAGKKRGVSGVADEKKKGKFALLKKGSTTGQIITLG